MEIKIVNQSDNELPAYETDFSAGMDLRADLKEAMVLEPMERMLIPTGLFIELPEGYEAQIRPRSGLALKHGIGLLNSPGTIDSDYRGIIGIIMFNAGKSVFTINRGDRIAQMIIAKVEHARLNIVEKLEESDRGAGGFGSTGIG